MSSTYLRVLGKSIALSRSSARASPPRPAWVIQRSMRQRPPLYSARAKWKGSGGVGGRGQSPTASARRKEGGEEDSKHEGSEKGGNEVGVVKQRDKKLRQKTASSHLPRMPRYARVLVDDSAGKAFDYELPE